MRDIMAGMDEKDRECCCSSTSPLYLTVTCPVFVLPRCPGPWIFLGDDFWNGFRMLLSSVRQWLHVRRQSTVAFGRISYFLRDGLDDHGWLALEIWTLFQQAALMTSWMGFFLPHFAAFFALRPHGRECSFFSPR